MSILKEELPIIIELILHLILEKPGIVIGIKTKIGRLFWLKVH